MLATKFTYFSSKTFVCYLSILLISSIPKLTTHKNPIKNKNKKMKCSKLKNNPKKKIKKIQNKSPNKKKSRKYSQRRKSRKNHQKKRESGWTRSK